MDLLLLNVNENISAKSENIFNMQFIPRKLHPYKKRDYFWPNKYSFLHEKFI